MISPGAADAAGAAERALASGAFSQAAALCRRGLSAPGAARDARLLSALAGALCGLGEHAEARRTIDKAIKAAPGSPELRCRLGQVLLEGGRAPEAAEAFEAALAMRPGHPWALRGLADSLVRLGRAAEAADLLEGALRASAQAPADVALAFMRVAARVGREAQGAQVGRRLLAAPGLPPDVRAAALWAVAPLLDALGARDEAFGAWSEANRLTEARFDPAAHSRAVDEMIARWTPEAARALPRVTRKTDCMVFIVGMPRSGTSLVEQVIASHPRAFGAGELEYVNNVAVRLGGTPEGWGYVRDPASLGPDTLESASRLYMQEVRRLAPGAERITDKMPQNFLHLGLIAGMLPGARIIHCVRDPRDTCLSCFTHDFRGRGSTYAYRLEWLGAFFADYWRLMAHWKRVLPLPILDVRYEELTGAPEEGIRRLIDFCALPWDDRCLRFHETKREVRTLSREQVRQPMYRSAVARWRAYEAHLGPLIDLLPPDAMAEGPAGA